VTPRPVLPLTGERTAPGVWQENYWFRRHEVAYRHWAAAGTGHRVLEAGCGEGYGAALLSAAGAATVLALDLDQATLTHAASTYARVAAARANLVALPVADRAVDVVVCSQTLEHLWEQDRFLAECARVLRPGGRLLLSTPNRRTFPPGNVFHHRELDADELRDLVAASFADVRLEGVRHGARLARWEAGHGDLVAHQVAGDPSTWDHDLAAVVRSVTVDDFVIGPGVEGCLDLLVDAVVR
jgi:SAM-dependent methyltransferase